MIPAKETTVTAAPRARARKTPPPLLTAVPVPGEEPEVSEEERIESAKYVTGEQPAPRVFEEERFIFPETYGRNRVRLLVKDPQWLFAHWDVDPATLSALRSELGERAAALSRLTLKVSDPDHGGGAVIHLPENARSWYVRADRVRRAYYAELGVTLPSGEYRQLATSNVVRPPVGAASHRRATRRARYVGPRRAPKGTPAEWVAEDQSVELGGEGVVQRTGARRSGGPGPWVPALAGSGPGGSGADPGTVMGTERASDAAKGGASDVLGPRPSGGASDLYRR